MPQTSDQRPRLRPGLPALATTAILSSAAALAEPQPLDAAEIAELLSGNTIYGSWDGTNYRQFFAEDGTTRYFPADAPSSSGLWRVDAETGLFESWWERSGWSPYAVAEEDGTHYWLDGSTAHPFRVELGMTLD